MGVLSWDESFVKDKFVGFGGLGFVVEDEGPAKYFGVLYHDVLVARPSFVVHPVNTFTLDDTGHDIFEVPTFAWSDCRLVQTLTFDRRQRSGCSVWYASAL